MSIQKKFKTLAPLIWYFIKYHADFNIQVTLKIIKTKASLEFINPGSLKVDKMF